MKTSSVGFLCSVLCFPLPMCVHGLDVEREVLFGRLICFWSEPDHSMKWNLDVRKLFQRVIHKVRKDGPQHRLVTNYHNVSLPLQLHDDWLQPEHQVPIGLQKETELLLVCALLTAILASTHLSSLVAVVKLVVITRGKVEGVLFLKEGNERKKSVLASTATKNSYRNVKLILPLSPRM